MSSSPSLRNGHLAVPSPRPSSSSSSSSSDTVIVHVLLHHKPSTSLGIACNSQLIVRKLHDGSCAQGVMQLGDQIISINDEPVIEIKQLTTFLKDNPKEHLKLVVRRWLPRDKVQEMSRCRRGGNSNRQRLLIGITWHKDGPKLGMSIKAMNNRIVISRVTPNTLAFHILEGQDEILKVNEVWVENRDETKHMIVDLLSHKGYVNLLIDRARGESSKHDRVMSLSYHGAPSSPSPSTMSASSFCVGDINNNTRRTPGDVNNNTRRTPAPRLKSILKKGCREPLTDEMTTSQIANFFNFERCRVTLRKKLAISTSSEKRVKITENLTEHEYPSYEEGDEGSTGEEDREGGIGGARSMLPFANNSW